MKSTSTVVVTTITVLILVAVSQLVKSNLKDSRSNSIEELATLEEHLPAIELLKRPTFLIEATSDSVISRIGGSPHLPPAVLWPQWKEKPLSFLAQIDLSELPTGADPLGLPETGILSFFYNQDQETWGYDPEDGDSWSVLYTELNSSDCEIRETPEGMEQYGIYDTKPIQIKAGFTYPDWQEESIIALDLNDLQTDQYFQFGDSLLGGTPAHQLRGYAKPVQNSGMEYQCQLVSNGINLGSSDGWSDPRRAELEKDSDDWTLLFQLDTDDDTNMCWGDCGMLYFWIRKQDLAAKRLDNCWMVFQCY